MELLRTIVPCRRAFARRYPVLVFTLSALVQPSLAVANPPEASLAASPTPVVVAPVAEKQSLISRSTARCAEGYHALAAKYHSALQRSPENVEAREALRRDLWERRRQAVAKYLGEVRATWGLRVFFKVAPEEKPTASAFLTLYAPEITRWYHHAELLKPTFWMQLPFRVFTKQVSDKTYSLSPIEGTAHTLLQRPIQALSHRLLGREYQLTAPITFPLKFIANIIAFWPAYMLYDHATNVAVNDRLEGSVQEHGEEYDAMIEYDIRFDSIRQALKRGYVEDPITGERKHVGVKEARESAYKLNLALNSYVLYRNQFEAELSAEERRANAKIHFETVAPTMRAVLDQGMKDPGAGFLFTGEERPFTDEEQDALISLQNDALDRYRMARAYVYDYKNELAEIAKVPEAKRKLEQVIDNGFVRKLLTLQRDGWLTNHEVLLATQMNIEWELRLRMSPIMGLTPMRETAEGLRPLELVDTQLDFLEQISRRTNPGVSAQSEQ